MIDASCKVDILAIDELRVYDLRASDRPRIEVVGHKYHRQLVFLIVDGHRYMVEANNLESAIRDAANANGN